MKLIRFVMDEKCPPSVCDGLNMPGPGSGTVRRCGLVGVARTLLEEVCRGGGGLWSLLGSSYTQRGTQSLAAAFQIKM